MNRFSRRWVVAAMLAFSSGSAFPVLDVEGLDRAIDPCADFYQYANKRWIESNPIPDDQPRWGAFDSVVERNMRTLIAALDYARSQPDPPRGSPQRKAIDFYASGVDREAIAKAGLKPLEPALERIAAGRGRAGVFRAPPNPPGTRGGGGLRFSRAPPPPKPAPPSPPGTPGAR